MAKASRGSSTEKYNSVFATRLRLLFDEKPNATQAQLSETLGVTRQTVSQYVNGISEPGYDTLVKIADYFDVSLDYLLGRTETRTTDLTIKDVCEITGLDEHSIEILKSINACSKNDICGTNPLLEQNLDYAACLVNEFIDFALSSKDDRSAPCLHYFSFRTAAKQSQKSTLEWDQLSSDKLDKIIVSLSGTDQLYYIPAKTAVHFLRNLFCDEFNNYLASKYATKTDK